MDIKKYHFGGNQNLQTEKISLPSDTYEIPSLHQRYQTASQFLQHQDQLREQSSQNQKNEREHISNMNNKKQKAMT